MKNNTISNLLFLGKRKNIKAFTLIELIVVISILLILTTTGVFKFLNFVKQQEIKQKLIIIERNIKELDKKVAKYEIFDYELNFNISNTGKLLYTTYINNFDTINQSIIINDNITGSGIIKTHGTGSGIIKIYKKHKLYLHKEINRTNDFEFKFNDTSNYKINGTLSGEILNEILVNYFSEDSLYPEKNDLLELIEINTKENKTGTGYDSLVIKNIGGNKVIGNNEDEIYLFFHNNGIESFVKIEK